MLGGLALTFAFTLAVLRLGVCAGILSVVASLGKRLVQRHLMRPLQDPDAVLVRVPQFTAKKNGRFFARIST